MLRYFTRSLFFIQGTVNYFLINFKLKSFFSEIFGIRYMNKHLRLIYLLLITFALSMRVASAQTNFGSEEELKSQASKLFNDEMFEEAFPLYTQLTSIYPKDPTYNYRLGVCMLYASDDKEKPIAFLEFAANKPEVEKEVFFYLARAYHLNYRFDDAIKQYLRYKNVASASKTEKLMVNRQIEMCKNGKKLLRNLTDLEVIEKKEMSRADFFRSYDITGIGGKLLVKPDEDVFKSAMDKKKKEKSIIYLASNNNQIFFSSYGNDPERGKDIYVIRKLPSGEWSKPQTLGYPVNTEYDEDFPFLHPNGKVLYFCSKGHNSMGGFDVFKTKLNEETNTWNKPENLDFPINTPDDDILYITNESESEAYFSSARASKTGMTAVYHINIERKPIDIAIIKGSVLKNRDNQPLDVKITVKDLNENVIVGIYTSTAANGGYLINIPNSGKFLFTVETPGFETQSDVVEVPVQDVFRPIKQEISYELGTDKLIIKNLIDDVIDDANYLLALNFIKEKSKMDVRDIIASANTSASNLKDTSLETNATVKTNNAIATSTNTKLSNNDIVKIGYADAEYVSKEAKDLHEQADVALVLANQKNELSANKSRQATQLLEDASVMDDNVKKQAAIEEANGVTKEAEELSQETVAAFNLAKKIEFRAIAKDQEADLSLQYAKDLEAAVKSKKSDPALFTKLEEQQKKLDALSEQNNNPTLANSLKMDVDNIKRALDKALKTGADIKQEIFDNEALIVTTKADVDKERNEKVKQGLIDQMTGLKMDTEESKKDLVLNEQKVAQLQKEYIGLLNETALVSNVYDKAKIGTSEKATAEVAMVNKAKLEAQVNTIKNSNSENALALNKTSTTESILNNNTVTNSVVADNSATQTFSEAKMDYAQKYEDDIVAADKIENALERENIKLALYKDWSSSISVDLSTKKAAAKTEKNKSKKKELSIEIASLETELKDKQKTITTIIATQEKLKQEDALIADKRKETTKNTSLNNLSADNTTVTDSNLAAINTKYSEEIDATNGIKNMSDREKAKAETLINWSKAIDNYVEKQVKYMDASSNPEMKAMLSLKVKQGEVLSLEKKKEAEQRLAKLAGKTDPKIAFNTNASEINSNSGNNLLAANSTIISDAEVTKNNGNIIADTTAKATTNKTTAETFSKTMEADNLKTNTVSKINDISIVDSSLILSAVSKTENKTNVSSSNKSSELESNTADNGFVYTSSSASQQAIKAKILTKEAEYLSVQSNNLKTKAAAEKNSTTKNAIYAEAEDFSKQSEQKVIEAAQVAADANKTEYSYNQFKLEKFIKATQGNTADDILMAEMMKDEAAIYFNRAIKFYEVANTTTSFYEKESAMADAFKNELIALEKQQKAKDIYIKYTPDVTFDNTDFASLKTSASSKSKDNSVALNLSKKADNESIKNASNENSSLTDKSADTTNVDNELKKTDNAGENNISNSTQVNVPSIVGISTKTKTINVSDTTSKIDNADVNIKTSALTNNIFIKKSTPVYSNSKPIPVNEKLPEGLIFKVQIGAFRNPIPQDLFKGMSPITGETTPLGFIRYTAGLFTTFASADKVKEEIQAMGYKDAFVVGFYNGKRVSMTEAMEMTGGLAPSINKATSITNNTINTSNIASSSNLTTGNNFTASSETKTPSSINTQIDASIVSESVTVVTGLFYTVQIGVYSQPVPASKLFNVQPLYTEVAPNGNLRYNTGIYNNLGRASEAKNMVVDLGIKDAFIVAYNNGKRVSMIEADQLIKQGSAIFPSAQNMNVLPTFSEKVIVTDLNKGKTVAADVLKTDINITKLTNENNPETIAKEVSTQLTTPSNVIQPLSKEVEVTMPNLSEQLKVAGASNLFQIDSGLVFKVQIGAFKDEVPLEIANKFLKVANKGVKNYKDVNGLTIYTVGIYRSYEEAIAVKTEIITIAAISDAFIVSYKNGIKITVDEAKKMIGK